MKLYDDPEEYQEHARARAWLRDDGLERLVAMQRTDPARFDALPSRVQMQVAMYESMRPKGRS